VKFNNGQEVRSNGFGQGALTGSLLIFGSKSGGSLASWSAGGLGGVPTHGDMETKTSGKGLNRNVCTEKKHRIYKNKNGTRGATNKRREYDPEEKRKGCVGGDVRDGEMVIAKTPKKGAKLKTRGTHAQGDFHVEKKVLHCKKGRQ